MTGKRKNRSTLRISVILEALALLIFIMVAVLLNMENKNLGAIGVLLIVGNCILFPGLALFLISLARNKKGE